MPCQMLLKSSGKFIHHVMHYHKPAQLYKLKETPRTRPGTKKTTHENRRTDTYRRSPIFMLVKLYNHIPGYTKNFGQEDFFKYLKRHQLTFNDGLKKSSSVVNFIYNLLLCLYILNKFIYLSMKPETRNQKPRKTKT